MALNLELIAIPNGADEKAVAAHYWSRQMHGNSGPCAWAVRARNVAPEVARLKKAGIAVSEPAHSGRERPDGERLDWETANVGTEPNGNFFPFLIHDFTPRDKRSMPSGHPTTQDFTGVSRVVIAVRDMEASVARYRKAYGLPAPLVQKDVQADDIFGAKIAWFRDTPVVLASAANAQSFVAARIEQFGEGPCAFLLRMRSGGSYQARAFSHWFGALISWLDLEKLGWRLGFEI